MYFTFKTKALILSSTSTIFFTLCILFITPKTALATEALTKQHVTTEKLTQPQVKQLINDTFIVMQNHYIEPDIIFDTQQLVLARFNKGHYSSVVTMEQFAAVIGTDIRNITDDDHLSLYTVKPTEKVSHIRKHPQGKLTYNFAFEQVSYLDGNIGYLKFNKFHPNENAKETVDAAFNFLKHSDGMIIDLRDTVGGSPNLVQYMLSYFMPKNMPLWEVLDKQNTVVDRYLVTEEPKHHRFQHDYPIWIVTSHSTASASEIFTGTLQANNKAFVIGDTTTGAGFYVGVENITDELIFRISLLKPVISINQQNWEKIGIKPDLKVPTMDALNHAKRIAYAELKITD